MNRKLVIWAVKMLAWAIRNSAHGRDSVDTGQVLDVSEFFGEKTV